jgi:RNA polymerase sigma factor for flagellar operon FliA
MNEQTLNSELIFSKKDFNNSENKFSDETPENIKIRDKQEAMKLWNIYNAKNKPLHIRDQLIKRYAYIVNWVIGRFPNIESADFDKEDLIGYGTIGLIEAIDRYNPYQKCSFETFAINRVRGEVLDFLRSIDFLSRTGRSRVKRLQETVTKLELQFGRAPTDKEVQSAMDISEDDLRVMKREASAVVFSLDATESTKSFEEAKISLVDNLPAEGQTQEEFTEQSILRDKLAQAIDSLNPRERLVVALYHYQKLTFKEIGEVLSVSESRASQLHMKVLQKLRVLLKGYEL